MNNYSSRSLGGGGGTATTRKLHRCTIPFIIFSFSFSISIIYSSLGSISSSSISDNSNYYSDVPQYNNATQITQLVPRQLHKKKNRSVANSNNNNNSASEYSIQNKTVIHRTDEVIKTSTSSLLHMQTTDNYWNVTSWLDYEALTQPTRLIKSAKRYKYSCNTHPTSIEHTVSSDNDNKEKKLVISLSPIISTSNSNNNKRWPATLDFIPIYIQFHAYNNQSQPQTYGGDVFVIEYQSWSSVLPNTTNATISIKNAAYTIDGLDGSYSAVLFIPRRRQHFMTYLNVTLRHYYTCHTGLKIPQEVRSTSITYETSITSFVRNFGPLVWTQLRDVMLDISQEQQQEVDEQLIIHNRPTCTNFDEATFGIWQEENIHYPSELSMKEAEWYPIYCNLADTYGKVQPKQHLTPGKALRIGDSTTPYRIAEVGYPFSIPHTSQPKYHELWYADALWNMLHNDTFTTQHDTMYYQAGLHHLLHYNYNPQSIAKLIMKAVCQIGLVFSRNAKPIVVRGPNPIQQHLNDKVDQTALNARMINWYVRSLLVRYEYKLQNICEDLIHSDKISISSLVNVADEKNGGNIMSNEDTISLLQKEYNFTTTTEYYNDTNQVALSNYLHDLTRNDRIRLYRNRTIRWINTESYLLPRHERYRGGPPPTDKVHGHVDFMFFAEHWLYLKLEKMAREYIKSS